MELWELAARESIRDTVAAYAHYADSGRFAELADLFTADGVLEVRGGEVLHGRDAIRDFLGGVGADLAAASATPVIRHHTSNLRVEVRSPDEATGESYFLAVTEHGVDHWGRYRDSYALDGDRWRFAHRLARTDGAVTGGWAHRRSARD